MLPNERFALSCLQKYAESGDLIDNTNGVFAHCPKPKCEGGTEGVYLTFEDHQIQGVLQSLDFNRCCFFYPDVLKFFISPDVWPDDLFCLWDTAEQIWLNNQKQLSTVYWETATEEEKILRSQRISETYQNKPEHLKSYQLRGLKKYNQATTYETRRKRGMKAARVREEKMSPEDKRKRSERACLQMSKPVEVTFPNGLIGRYSSAKIASLFTGIKPTTLRTWATLNTGGKYGKNKGYSARYL